MKKWPVAVLRVFGGLHILASLTGGILIVWTFLVRIREVATVNPAFPYRLDLYVLDTILSALCLAFLAKAGVALFHLRRTGLRLSNIVLGFEIGWKAIELGVALSSMIFGGEENRIFASIITAWGTGQIGIAPQILVGYPVIALVVTNIAHRKLVKVQAPA